MVKKEKSFKEVLAEIESPRDIGKGSWALPKNATPLEKTKHEICQNILRYQRESKLTDEEISKRIDLTLSETEDLLYCRILYFTLDRLMTYASRLFEPLELKIVKAQNKKIIIRNGSKERKNLRV
jgi:predicted XRE-type DNA-binding protein